MKIRVQDRLPFVTVTIRQADRVLSLDNVLLDTGSAGCVFATDKLQEAGIYPQSTAHVRRIRGVGGQESVVDTAVDEISVGELTLRDFTIEAGAMDYGFDIAGILGFDFLQQTGAVIDLSAMEIRANG
jgi:predicted aspartyl protease